MELNVDDALSGQTHKASIEAVATTEAQTIKLNFPSLFQRTKQRIAQRAIIIDSCYIVYKPYIPGNATGTVRLSIYDRRLQGKDAEQAQFIFPVTCPVQICYYGNCYSSLKEEDCPWTAKYRLENSNLTSKTFYCKFKANLRLTTSKDPELIAFRPPKIHILNPKFTEDQVDVWHVADTVPDRQLCRTVSGGYSQQNQFCRTVTCLQGQSHSEINTQCARNSVTGVPFTNQINDEDPGPSISEVGSSSTPHIVLTAEQLGVLTSTTVKSAIETIKQQNTPAAKPKF